MHVVPVIFSHSGFYFYFNFIYYEDNTRINQIFTIKFLLTLLLPSLGIIWGRHCRGRGQIQRVLILFWVLSSSIHTCFPVLMKLGHRGQHMAELCPNNPEVMPIRPAEAPAHTANQITPIHLLLERLLKTQAHLSFRPQIFYCPAARETHFLDDRDLKLMTSSSGQATKQPF